MEEKSDKNKKIDDIYQKAQASVSDLGHQQMKKAILYIKKNEQKKISDLRKLISQK